MLNKKKVSKIKRKGSNNKTKGSKNERELFQMFVTEGFRAVRVAGSGLMENADCDLLAGKKGKKYCIEAKSTKQTIQYISKDQISRFLTFAEIFALKPVIAIRFNHKGWYFLHPKNLADSGKNWSISLKNAQKKGKRFSQFFGEKIKYDKDLEISKEAKLIEYDQNLRGIEDKEYIKSSKELRELEKKDLIKFKKNLKVIEEAESKVKYCNEIKDNEEE